MSLSFPLTQSDHAKSAEERAKLMENPGFGRIFTDHMALATWSKDEGWHDGKIVPYGPLQLDPAAAVLHYAQEVFEGMKAYRHEDGSVWTFRPERNAERMQRSAQRLAMPELPTEDFIASVKALVAADEAWVPAYGEGEKSLYLRPFMFASEPFLGVRPANELTYCLIASPAGAYFSGGIKPVNLWVSTKYARAGAGGTGAAKCGGNYASSLAGQLEGQEHGCDQAVFLDSATHEYIEELGGMNLFFVWKDGRLTTPALTGSILEGVTRDSILTLAKEQGLTPVEERIKIQDWKDGAASGDLLEVFACGTAAVVTPVGELRWDGGSCTHRTDATDDKIAMAIRNELLGVQYGTVEDSRDWLTRLV